MATQPIRERGAPGEAEDNDLTKARHEMTPVIEVTGLTKRYGGQTVVDGITFHVEQGEIFGILGPNGAGKTTAVECMEGLRRRDAGQVRILGLDPKTDGRRLHQRIGVQLQETQLQDKLKVREALELYASFYPDPADWRELLDRWGLGGKRDTRFGKLSGGQKQRLFIALALVGNPELVFLDELTAGLDPGARRATWDLIAQVRNSGVTVVLVSHFMDEVEELCDRVAILERGRIAALDTPAGLVDSAGGEYRMRFRPVNPGLDDRSLAIVPGVTGVERRGAHVTVTGTGDFASAVTAELARRQVIVADLRIEGRSLDSAYVALTGKTLTGKTLTGKTLTGRSMEA
jgi:ABC-2 type transport system ATP-binding protein